MAFRIGKLKDTASGANQVSNSADYQQKTEEGLNLRLYQAKKIHLKIITNGLGHSGNLEAEEVLEHSNRTMEYTIGEYSSILLFFLHFSG